jgi:hypothetical protein
VTAASCTLYTRLRDRYFTFGGYLMDSTVPADLLKLLRHEVALITVKTARAGLHPLLHQRFSTGMNKELPGQCNLIT